jgi:SAM-dependent methyltransferase
MRDFLVQELNSWLKKNTPSLKKIAVVGGSPSEPELKVVQNLYPDTEVKFFGVESPGEDVDFVTFDLNFIQSPNQHFDLVICSQVLEHVWNVQVAIENLRKLVKPETGLLWINCPASNMVHGSPHYYSAGYSPEMLEKLALNNSLEVLSCGSVGSRRLYFFTHALQYWPSKFELAHPVISYRPLRSYGRKIVQESIRGSLGRLYAALLSNQKSADLQYATESYLLARTKES